MCKNQLEPATFACGDQKSQREAVTTQVLLIHPQKQLGLCDQQMWWIINRSRFLTSRHPKYNLRDWVRSWWGDIKHLGKFSSVEPALIYNDLPFDIWDFDQIFWCPIIHVRCSSTYAYVDDRFCPYVDGRSSTYGFIHVSIRRSDKRGAGRHILCRLTREKKTLLKL